MKYIPQKNPRLPANEAGWFLFKCAGVWRCGYSGSQHKGWVREVKTEQEGTAMIRHSIKQMERDEGVMLKFFGAAPPRMLSRHEAELENL